MAVAQAQAREVSDSEYQHLRRHNGALVDRALEALDAGDRETSDECLCQMYRSAEDLLSVKHILGADWIRRKRLDTMAADEKYGRDWLDRDILPLRRI